MKNLSVLPILLVVFLGCSKAPEFKPNVGQSLGSSLGPRQTDVTLAFDESNQSVAGSQAYLKSSGLASSGEVLQMAKHLLDLSQRVENGAPLANLANAVMSSFYQGGQTSNRHYFEQSHLVKAVLSQIQENFGEALGDLEGQGAILESTVRAVVDRYTFTDMNTFMDEVTTMIFEIKLAVENNSQLNESVSSAVVETFDRYLAEDIPNIRTAFETGLAENNALALVNLVEGKLAEFEYEMDADAAKRLADVKVVAQEIDAILDQASHGVAANQMALSATVKLWYITDEAKRPEFAESSQILYDQLSTASAEELECLERYTSCDIAQAFYETFTKALLLTGFENEGPANTQTSLNQKVSDGIRESLWETAQATGTSVVDGVVEGFTEKETELIGAANDIENKLQPSLATFAQDHLNDAQFSLLETNLVNLDINGSDSITTSGFLPVSVADTSAHAYGAGLSALATKWIVGQDQAIANLHQHRVEVIGALNKVFAAGGYTTPSGDVFAGLARATLVPDHRPYDLANTEGLNMAYTIADRESIAGVTSGARSISMKQQAAVLNGFVDMMNYLRDWETNSYDQALGGYVAGDILTAPLAELADERADTPVFPKADMYALAVGQLAVQLKGLSLSGSPLVLVAADGSYTTVKDSNTADEFESIGVTVVGWTEGNRDTSAKVREAADFLYAMTRVYRAIEEMENTQSEKLLDRTDGASALEQLREAKNDSLRSLILGMATFLTGKAQSANGAVAEEVTLEGFERKGVGFSIRTQTAVIRSLVAASDILGSPAYTWAAQDIYFAMNRDKWDPSIHFYKADEDLDMFLMADTLNALSMLRPHLPEASQTQLDKITSRWYQALGTF